MTVDHWGLSLLTRQHEDLYGSAPQQNSSIKKKLKSLKMIPKVYIM